MNWISTIRMTSVIPSLIQFEIIGVFAIHVLIIGFIIHLLLRAFWLALLCINFVYPQGINKGNIKHKKPFKTKSNLFDLETQIMKLDKYCASIMYLSIISFVSILGLIFTLFFYDFCVSVRN